MRLVAVVLAALALAVPAAVAAPSGPAVASEWWLQHDGVDAAAVWARTTGAGVVVADLDSGADAAHPDLAGALLPVIDVSGEGGAGDTLGHGTSVAGVIAARGVDGLPAGIAPGARVLAVKISGDDRVQQATLAHALRYVAERPDVRVINLSLGGPDEPDVAAAVRYALAQGKLVVAAAGNMGLDVEQELHTYPCVYAGVLCVGATTRDGALAWWSNYSADLVAVAAPGVGIVSTWPGGGVETHDGTSLAAPVVSGIAALLFAAHPEATAAQVRAAIVLGVRPVRALYGYVQAAGEANAPAALAALDGLLASSR
ncbi:MAG TPA: S8 family serine peptidase [Gaiellaceae bacterium]|nr:S8 family serine peptidase [Gaiellaceae bacterium]